MIDYSNPNEMWRQTGFDPYKGMSDEERIKAGCLQLVGIVGGIIVALLICALFGSCTTTEYVTVEKIKYDTTYISKLQRDSVWLHDSIYVHEWTKGDTVYRDRDRWHTVYRVTKYHDTVYQSRVDSVPVPYPVIKEVEKPLKKTQTGLMFVGCLSMMVLIVYIAIKIKRFLPLR